MDPRKDYTAFRDYLAEFISGAPTRFLREMSLVDPITNGPNLGAVHRLLPPQDQKIPYALSVVLGSSPEMGAAHEALGNIDSALSWYHLGQYRWRSDEPFVLGSDGSEAVARRYAFPDQLSAAVCADRVGERERAYQLYGWAVDYLIYKKDKYPSYSYFWDMQPKLAYALSCLGRWNEALALAEEVQHEVDGSTDYFEKQNNSSMRLLPVILGVARYHVDPTPEHRQNAMEMIHSQTVACLWHPAHLEALLYLYALRSRLPDLANPLPTRLPYPKRSGTPPAPAGRRWQRAAWSLTVPRRASSSSTR